jgi:deoxycytidine triphosphate deaminase
MPKVISGKRLQEAIENNKFLSGGDASSCDGIKYDFRLDDCILKPKFGVPVNYSSFPIEKQGTELVVTPGEMVFVMTKETLNLPINIYSQLSPRRKMTEFGIVTLGGFAIDPGYNGKLLFGLYNVSSEDFKLVPNAKLAGAVFYELEDDELLSDYTPPKAIDGFSSTLIEKISKYQPIGIKTLEESVKEIKKQLEVFEKGLSKNTDAIDKLEELVHKTSKNIERISEDINSLKDALKLESESRKNALEQESKAREVLSKEISEDIGNLKDSLKLESESRKNALELESKAREDISKKINTKIERFKGALWLATALGAAFVALLIGVLTGLIKF